MEKKLTITNIHPGHGDHQSRILYADLMEGDKIIANATLDFFLMFEYERRNKIENYFQALQTYIDFNEKLKKGKKYPEGIIGFSKYGIALWGGTMPKPTYQDWVDDCLGQGLNIFSVKNSLGEILSIGDETNFGKIQCFKIHNESIWVGANKVEDGGIAPNMNDVHPKKKEKQDDLYLLLIELFPELKNDGFLIQKTFEFFGLNEIVISDFTKKEQQKIYKEMVEDIRNGLLLRSLIQNRFHTEKKKVVDNGDEENKPRFSKNDIRRAAADSSLSLSMGRGIDAFKLKEKLGL